MFRQPKPSPGSSRYRPYQIAIVAAGVLAYAGAVWGLEVPVSQALPVVFILLSSAFIALFIFQNVQVRADLERRLQDLSMLNQISQVIRYATDLDSLLKAVHTQLTELLGIDSFYVALYDQPSDSLWYPLAVKEGEYQQWPRRPLANRLTDRVIKEKRPLMLGREATLELERIGVPLGEEPLYSWLGVPLITPDRTLGCLAVLSLSPVAFTEDDLNLLNTLSGQISIALQNALLYEQTGLALSRQTQQLNILELIGRQLSAALQSDALFELILDYALEFTESPWGGIAVHNPVTESFEIRVARGYDLSQKTLPADTGIAGRVLRSGKAEIVNDVTKDREYTDLTDHQTLSQLTAPIVYKERVMGILSIESPRRNEFTDIELNFATQLAQQAALALHNASLYEEAQRRLREQATLFLVSARLVADKELDDVLTTVAQAFSAALGSFLVGVYIWQPAEKQYQRSAVMQRDHDFDIDLPAQLSPEDWEDFLHQEKTSEPLQITREQKKLARAIGLKETIHTLVFPLQVAGQDLGLVICHLSSERTYSSSELQLADAIAAQSSIAIQNALLFSDVSSGRDRLAAVLDSVGEGILMIDSLGRVILANSPIEKLTRTPVERITGERLFDLPKNALRALGIKRTQAQTLSLAVGTQDAQQEEPHPYSYDHKDRFYERWIAPVFAANGQTVLGWVIVIRDITEQRQIDQARELLTETLVHDLRSPISAVKTTLDLLEESIPADDRDQLTQQSMEIARRSTQRVLALIGSLLDLSWLESGQLELETEEVAVQELVDGAVSEAIPQANRDGIILRSEVPGALPNVQIDLNLVRRVLANLIDNALKFTPEGGIVTVQSEAGKNGQVVIQVCDTGPGIPEDYHEEVFSRFSQVPGLRGRRRGTGIGLTFCRLAVEAHGGKIWVKPLAPGAGATLAFSLPTAEDHTN